MIFQVLGCGTSTGVPLPGCRCPVCTSENPKNKRSRTSAIIRLDDGQNILIDTSPDLRWQSLQFDVRNVNAVLFTHAHADHILGMDDLRSFNFIQRSSIPCYASATTAKEIRRFFTYIFQPMPDYEGGALAKLTLHEIDDSRPLEIAGVKIIPFKLFHGKAEVLGYRIGSVAFATDCNKIPEESMKTLEGVSDLFLDGLRYEPHRTHFTIHEAIEVANKIGARKTYLIHTSHSIDYDEEMKKYPPSVELAYDGLKIPISY